MAYTSPPESLTLVLDGHLHIYPSHNLENLTDACLRGLAVAADKHGSESQPAALLTESAGHHFFRDARASLSVPGPCRVEAGPDDDTLWLHHPGHSMALLIFGGRQIVTAERLEVLALTRDLDLPDGLSMDETLQRVSDGGGVACLAWAPGKWWGKREKIIEKIVMDTARFLTIGDSALRPRGWLEPGLMQAAAMRKWPILAGSDPLPFPGDEMRAGQYGCRITLDAYDPRQPAAALRAALARGNGNGIVQRIGRRCDPVTWLHCQTMHRRSKHSPTETR